MLRTKIVAEGYVILEVEVLSLLFIQVLRRSYVVLRQVHLSYQPFVKLQRLVHVTELSKGNRFHDSSLNSKYL